MNAWVALNGLSRDAHCYASPSRYRGEFSGPFHGFPDVTEVICRPGIDRDRLAGWNPTWTRRFQVLILTGMAGPVKYFTSQSNLAALYGIFREARSTV